MRVERVKNNCGETREGTEETEHPRYDRKPDRERSASEEVSKCPVDEHNPESCRGESQDTDGRQGALSLNGSDEVGNELDTVFNRMVRTGLLNVV